ncbi:MAG: RtcB family protein, partial [Desulfosarcinaceae bacterium]
MQLQQIDKFRWQVQPFGDMKVPGVVYTNEAMLAKLHEEQALAQVANVATLPGILRASLAMPDIHWGYGFPIGGVA